MLDGGAILKGTLHEEYGCGLDLSGSGNVEAGRGFWVKGTEFFGSIKYLKFLKYDSDC
jgi:hypothetical protein